LVHTKPSSSLKAIFQEVKEVALLIIRNEPISSSPNRPASSDKDLCENMAAKISSSLYDHIRGLKIEIPVNGNGAPTVYTERALKK